MTTIAIIGLGYVSLPFALRFAEAGVRVLGLDIDPKKVEALNAGTSYIKHIRQAHLPPPGRESKIQGLTDPSHPLTRRIPHRSRPRLRTLLTSWIIHLS